MFNLLTQQLCKAVATALMLCFNIYFLFPVKSHISASHHSVASLDKCLNENFHEKIMNFFLEKKIVLPWILYKWKTTHPLSTLLWTDLRSTFKSCFNKEQDDQPFLSPRISQNSLSRTNGAKILGFRREAFLSSKALFKTPNLCSGCIAICIIKGI